MPEWLSLLNLRRIFAIKLGNRKALLFLFILGFALRVIPEALSYPYPIGFETLFYVARIKTGVIWPHWTWIFSSWLLYAILIPLQRAVQVDPFLLLKLVAPTLYGVNASAVYYFARKALNWDIGKSFGAASFLTFQLATLRISWDLFRNFLGLALLLFALPHMPWKTTESKRQFLWFALLSLLIVFSHELVSIVLLAIFMGLAASHVQQRRKDDLLKALSFILPSTGVVVTSLFMLTSDKLAPFNLSNSNIISLESHPTGLFLIVNYLNYSGTVRYSTYLELALNILPFFAVLYLLSLPLVLVGFFRHRILDWWTTLLLVGSLGALIVPFFALDLWDRWMLMLVYPFTFYATNGVDKVLKSKGASINLNWRWTRWIRVSRRTASGIVFLTILLFLFSMTVNYGAQIPGTSLYVPSMYVNTIPLEDIGATMDAINWLNTHAGKGSSVLVHLAFRWWVVLNLSNSDPVVFYFTRDVESALDAALLRGFDSVYFIWWNQEIGWYNLSIPNHFRPVFASERISVFEHF